mmetsp:Transcript_7620/g.24396  ORF Transcript_7620/g.24396 Transcript_7620/m.24396 type:complete len:87 (-) Transcript_7620:115-375(-)
MQVDRGWAVEGKAHRAITVRPLVVPNETIIPRPSENSCVFFVLRLRLIERKVNDFSLTIGGRTGKDECTVPRCLGTRRIAFFFRQD